jgi:tetratricopeptide (TPR) repeat protein
VPAFDFFAEYLRVAAGNYLEIGVFEGDSIARLARLYPQKQIFAVDPFIEDGYTDWITHVGKDKPLNSQRSRTLENIAGLENITLFECTSTEFFHNLAAENAQQLNVTAVFIDGNHHEPHVINDVELAMTLIGNNRGIVFFDDIDHIARYLFQLFFKFRDKITGFQENRSKQTMIWYLNGENPVDVVALNDRGLALYELKRFDEALACFNTVLAINPNVVEAHCNRGNALIALNRFEEALVSYDKALTIKRDCIIALNNRGCALVQSQRFDEALASYDKALTIKPDYLNAINNRASLLQRLQGLNNPART